MSAEPYDAIQRVIDLERERDGLLRERRDLRVELAEAQALLREASELWTTSRAREERGVWDAEWDKRRVAFLATFVAEKATAP